MKTDSFPTNIPTTTTPPKKKKKKRFQVFSYIGNKGHRKTCCGSMMSNMLFTPTSFWALYFSVFQGPFQLQILIPSSKSSYCIGKLFLQCSHLRAKSCMEFNSFNFTACIAEKLKHV